MIGNRFLLPVCLALGLAALGRPASAQLEFHVQVDTSNLDPSATYYTEFTLTDGQVQSTGIPSTNNSVLLNDFNFGTGASGAVLPPDIGNASGSTASAVLLADGDPGGVADHAQAFTPGAILGFDATVTTIANSGGIPDTFTFFLLDSGLTPLPTNAPAQTPNAFLRLDITGPTVTIASVNSYSNSTLPVPAPQITAVTPEPGALAFSIGVALCGSLTALRRHRLVKKR